MALIHIEFRALSANRSYIFTSTVLRNSRLKIEVVYQVYCRVILTANITYKKEY